MRSGCRGLRPSSRSAPLGRALVVLDPAQVGDPVGRRGPARRAVGERPQRAGQVAVELGGDRPRRHPLGLGGVQHDKLGLRAERLPEAEPEVHRHAGDERHVGLPQGGAAGAREEQGVAGRHAAAGEPVEEHGHAPGLGERQQLPLGAAPVDVRPGHDHGPLGVAQERGGAREPALVRPRRGVRRRGLRLGLGRLPEDDVEREVEERRPAVGPRGDGERLVDQGGDLRGGGRGGRELDERPHERDVVDLLQRALAPAEGRRAPAEHEHRRVALLRRGHRAHPVGHPGARGQRAHARLAGDLRPPLGGEGGRLLVADVDQVDALRAAAVVEREEVAAGEGEHPPDAVRLQPAGDQAAPVQGRGLLVRRGHEGGTYPPDRGV